MNSTNNTLNHITAQYHEQRIPRHQGNLLIEALPISQGDSDIFEHLLKLPQFDEEQRSWPAHERMLLSMELFHSLIPSSRHIQLARLVDTMIRDGYAGRPMNSAKSNAILNQIYKDQKAGTLLSNGPQHFSTTAMTKAVIGYSGAGKSTALRNILAMYPPVIFHPETHTFQIPYLFIETPHDGSSIKGLCYGIFRKIDSLVPGADYYDRYATRGRPSDETLLAHIARVLHIHRVGLLVCDEIQNLENAHKNKQSLMTLLVSASNEFGVPLLFVGTNKAKRVLSLDFRQARRSSNVGPTVWDRMERGENSGEWDTFLDILWDFQWVKNPEPLTPALSALMYARSQGITDVVLKLFVIAQWRAIQDGSERITAALIEQVASQELGMLKPMLEAIRTNNLDALDAYTDIAPLDLQELAHSYQTANRYTSLAPYRSEANNTNTGVDNAPTDYSVDTSIDDITPHTKEAVIYKTAPASKSPNRSPTRIGATEKGKVIELKAKDLRGASQQAKNTQTDTFTQLQKMGMVSDLNKVLGLG